MLPPPSASVTPLELSIPLRKFIAYLPGLGKRTGYPLADEEDTGNRGQKPLVSGADTGNSHHG
jgi:hypothetical protein